MPLIPITPKSTRNWRIRSIVGLADDAAVARADHAAGDDHLEIGLVAQEGRHVEVVGDHPQPDMAQQLLGDLLGGGADVDEQRGMVGDVRRHQPGDAPLLLDAQHLPVEIGDVLDRGGERSAAMMPLQDRLLAQRIDVAADRLRRDGEPLGQGIDADEALAPDQVDDLGAALFVARQPARLPSRIVFDCEHATRDRHCKAKVAQLRTRSTARRHPSSSRCRSRGRHRRLEAAVQAPGRGDLLQRAVDAGGEPGEVGRTQCRGLHHRRPLDRTVKHVGQELAQPVVDDHAAVDPQRAESGLEARRPACRRRRRRRGRRSGRPPPPVRRARCGRHHCRG